MARSSRPPDHLDDGITRDQLKRRHIELLNAHIDTTEKAQRRYNEYLAGLGQDPDTVDEDAIPPAYPSLNELNNAIKTIGAEVRALGARGVKSLAADPAEIEPAEQVPRLRLLKPTGKLDKRA